MYREFAAASGTWEFLAVGMHLRTNFAVVSEKVPKANYSTKLESGAAPLIHGSTQESGTNCAKGRWQVGRTHVLVQINMMILHGNERGPQRK